MFLCPTSGMSFSRPPAVGYLTTAYSATTMAYNFNKSSDLANLYFRPDLRPVIDESKWDSSYFADSTFVRFVISAYTNYYGTGTTYYTGGTAGHWCPVNSYAMPMPLTSTTYGGTGSSSISYRLVSGGTSIYSFKIAYSATSFNHMYATLSNGLSITSSTLDTNIVNWISNGYLNETHGLLTCTGYNTTHFKNIIDFSVWCNNSGSTEVVSGKRRNITINNYNFSSGFQLVPSDASTYNNHLCFLNPTGSSIVMKYSDPIYCSGTTTLSGGSYSTYTTSNMGTKYLGVIGSSYILKPYGTTSNKTTLSAVSCYNYSRANSETYASAASKVSITIASSTANTTVLLYLHPKKFKWTKVFQCILADGGYQPTSPTSGPCLQYVNYAVYTGLSSPPSFLYFYNSTSYTGLTGYLCSGQTDELGYFTPYLDSEVSSLYCTATTLPADRLIVFWNQYHPLLCSTGTQIRHFGNYKISGSGPDWNESDSGYYRVFSVSKANPSLDKSGSTTYPLTIAAGGTAEDNICWINRMASAITTSNDVAYLLAGSNNRFDGWAYASDLYKTGSFSRWSTYCGGSKMYTSDGNYCPTEGELYNFQTGLENGKWHSTDADMDNWTSYIRIYKESLTGSTKHLLRMDEVCKQACLLEDTMVLMSDGSEKRIDEIKVGDYVLSVDYETGELTSRRVIFSDSNTIQTAKEYDIWTFEDGYQVKTAHRHEFYCVEDKRWKYMDEWNLGEHAYTIDGKKVALLSHENVKEEAKHYKITLEGEGCNNFFANGLLNGDRYCPKDFEL